VPFYPLLLEEGSSNGLVEEGSSNGLVSSFYDIHSSCKFVEKLSESGFMKRLDQSETSDFLPGGAPSDEPSQSGAMPHWWHTSAQNLYSNATIQVLSGNQEDDIVLKKRVSRPHREEETSVVWPNICDDKQGFAKYSWKKLPEMCDDKRYLTLETAELLPNMYDNHHFSHHCQPG
jgi:hypothetical protein